MFQVIVMNTYDSFSYTYAGTFVLIQDAIQLASRYNYDDNVICKIIIV